MALLRRVEEQRRQEEVAASRVSIGFIVLIAAGLLALLALVLIGFITVVGWLIRRPGAERSALPSASRIADHAGRASSRSRPRVRRSRP